MTAPARLAVVATGLPETFDDHHGHTIRTAIRNQPRTGPVVVHETGLEGDGVVSEKHGGPHMRVHAFGLASYDWFDERAGRKLPRPAFGDNLIVEGYDESTGRAGDRVRVGSVVFRVTQPTQRCAKIGRSLGIDGMEDWFTESGLTGWYLAVEEPGTLEVGDTWELLERGPEYLALDRLNRWIVGRDLSDDTRRAAESPLLGPAFARNLRRRLDEA